MAFQLPPLPYDYAALEPHIDEATMRVHHDKHHQAYVDKANAALEGTQWADTPAEEILKNLDALPDAIRGPVRNNGGGHANHSLFWQIMSPDGGGEPDGDLGAAIADTFGSFGDLKQKVNGAGANQFGSGWAWLVWNGSGLEVTSTPNQDSPLSAGQTPLLGVDVWEHAYYLKYQNKRPDYLEAWWNVVNWAEVARRYEAATGQARRAVHGEDLGSLDLAIEADPVPLDPHKLEELARWRPQHGVLTIYVDADPTVQAHAAPPWRVQIDNELRAIEERLRSNGLRERWAAFSTMLDGTAQAREEITRAASPGRGRLLMLPLDGGSAYALAIQRPLPTAVFLDEGPRLLPLVSALGRGALIGVILATKDRIDVAETRLGRVRQVEARRFSVDDDVADRRGPAAANPSRAQQTVSHVEKHERHVDALRERFIRSVMADVSTRRAEAGWEGVVIAGPPGVAEALGRALSDTGARVVHHHIGDSEVADVVEALASEIDDFAGEREAAALAGAIDAARGGGHGVVGLELALDALNDGRVTHLFLPLEADRQGALLADGRIACDHGGDPSAVLVHSLFEAMLARALATGATVSVLSSGTVDDVVAATRWVS